jgi:glycosyltransferase involved in cell wall biosynthesis
MVTWPLTDSRSRVLAVCSHPVQYMAPLLRRMAQHPRLDLSVAYCTLKGAQAAHDPEFNTTVQWDVPLLEGYSWQEIPNHGSGAESFWGLNNPGLGKLIRVGKFDAVLCYLSYRCASFWISYFACRRSGTAFIFGTDASSLVPRSGGTWKHTVKKALWPKLFSLADQVIVPSSATRELMLSLRIPEERITLTPYSVDNDWWMAQSHNVDREAVRAEWGATPQACVILFCAKLQPWKRPLDLLRAFAQADHAHALLVYAGEGPQRPELERETAALRVGDHVRFLGFKNQSELPAVYTAADLMVLPSEYEPFAVVVNEASCCSCPVVASDRVGAARDLIAPVDPTLIYPCGDVLALTRLLRNLLADRVRLLELGRAARRRMETWSPRENIAGTIQAIGRAVAQSRRHMSTAPVVPSSTNEYSGKGRQRPS